MMTTAPDQSTQLHATIARTILPLTRTLPHRVIASPHLLAILVRSTELAEIPMIAERPLLPLLQKGTLRTLALRPAQDPEALLLLADLFVTNMSDLRLPVTTLLLGHLLTIAEECLLVTTTIGLVSGQFTGIAIPEYQLSQQQTSQPVSAASRQIGPLSS
jgi:hypothetical protein